MDAEGRQSTFSQQQSAGNGDVCIEGAVERIVYESRETGFFVGRLIPAGSSESICFVGNLLAVSPGETIRLWGRWVDDKRFGRQLRVERYQTVMPATAAAIEKYLGSGLVRGIGPVFAKRLVKAFGVETLRVIDEEPKRLRDVPGIGRKRATQIREAWQTQKAIQSIMLFLQGHGIGVGQAIRIYKRYGDAAVAVLRENPYCLAEDIAGIGFKGADAIAEQLGITKDSPKRIEAGLLYVLRQALSEGHALLPAQEAAERAVALLDVTAEQAAPLLAGLEERAAIVRERDDVYLPAQYQAETGCAVMLKRLIAAPAASVSIHVEKAIEWVERTKSIQLAEEQRQAIRVAIGSKVMVITGGPGTGKTTILNGILEIFGKKGVSIALAAPTGRAAKRMEAATGRSAQTIHRLLEYSPKEGGFLRHEGNPLPVNLVVIDEVSMVDAVLMHSLVRALEPAARLILVGDVDQLPSVGAGNVLTDIIASNVIPVVWLKTVFRQAEESGIVANAHRINTGQQLQFNTTDFFFVERPEPSAALETVVDLVAARIPAKFGFDAMREIQVLAPMHRGEAGVTRLNEALQRALNPGGAPVAGKNFRAGDKVMQMRNNYELDVFNGDVGVVQFYDEEMQETEIEFDGGRRVLYAFEDLDELALAYAATIHKSQGSEYPAVVIPLLTQHFPMLQRNVLYTAVTRAAKLVVIVGMHKAVGIAVRNTDVARRYTRLAERLRNER